MGKLKVLGVLFSGNQDVYKPGDTIYGDVMIVVSEEKGDIRGIQIKCVGKSYTHWTETERRGDTTQNVSFTSSHEYFKLEVTLSGAGKGDKNADRIKLPAGEHKFPFQFQIPSMSLPAPFEGPCGCVRYYVKVCIDRPWKFDHHTTRLFSIFTVKDLNYEPNVLVPPSHQIEKTVCCLCCASGPIVVHGLLDKRGYVPGEHIFVSLDLHNNSSRTIVDITVKLQQTAHFIAFHNATGRAGHRHATKKITELKLDGCEAMGSMNYDRMKMLIPPIPPWSVDNSPNILLEYFVEIEAGVSGTPMDATVKLPVVIGTIPAFQHTLKDPSQAPQGIEAYAPYAGQPISVYPPAEQPGYPPAGQPGYPSAEQPGYSLAGQPAYPPAGQTDPTAGLPPPPTYAAAVGGPQEIAGKKGAFGTVMYAPQYPYYDPDTLCAAMGIPPGVPSTEGGVPPPPTTTQPQSIQQPPYNPYPDEQKDEGSYFEFNNDNNK